MPLPAVRARLEPLLVEGLITTCCIIDLEIGYAARDAATHAALRVERRALPRVTVDDSTLDRALHVQGMLAERGQHRLPIPDLILAAAAESAGLTLLHYDTDFELIAAVTQQRHEWIAVRGSI